MVGKGFGTGLLTTTLVNHQGNSTATSPIAVAEGQLGSLYCQSSGKLQGAQGYKFNNTVKIWDIAIRIYTQMLGEHSSFVRLVAPPSNSKLVISRLWDNTIKTWDTATGIYTQTLERYNRYVLLVAFFSNLKLIASGLDN